MIPLMQATTTERIGSKIRELMTASGVSQQRVADLLGMSQPGISRRLTGLVPFDVNELVAIAQLLDVPPASLLDDA